MSKTKTSKKKSTPSQESYLITKNSKIDLVRSTDGYLLLYIDDKFVIYFDVMGDFSIFIEKLLSISPEQTLINIIETDDSLYDVGVEEFLPDLLNKLS